MEDYNKRREGEQKNVKAMKTVGIILLVILVIYLVVYFSGFMGN